MFYKKHNYIKNVQYYLSEGIFKYIHIYPYKDLVKTGTKHTVKATSRDVTTILTKHAIERALEWEISELVLDNLLSGKPESPMFVVQNFDDVAQNSRIIYDAGSENVVVLDRFTNQIITVYRDTDQSAKRRIANGTWKKAKWIFGIF
ncbi:hypothetical protein NSS64_29925 [Paenibacillus sp. FSL H8-0122]|uniref:hypothetical protein n=1 Tax=Paenibacillus sp. FSL H8-0122 TaxID=2954510 RepID=UPI0030FBF6DE